MKLIDIGDVKKIPDENINKEKKGVMGKIGDIIKKLVDCCKE